MPELKKIQKALLPFLGEFPLYSNATAKKGSNILKNAMPHLQAKYILQMDIKNCFSNTDRNMIELGARWLEVKEREWYQEFMYYLPWLLIFDGWYEILPTGAPTSPLLANIALTPIDSCIINLIKDKNIVYTRYMDDITLSTQDNYRNWNLIYDIETIFNYYNYESNKRKTKWKTVGQQDNIKITGVQITGKRRVPKELRRKIRAMVHRSKGIMNSELQGYLAFSHSLDVQFYNNMMTRFNAHHQ